jgi:hypothetical protein
VASPAFLRALVQANVVSSNCGIAFAISRGEWSLLTGTVDKMAAALKLNTDTYDAEFYSPAFASLDEPVTCLKDGPKVRPLLDQLIGMGGGTTAID